MKSNDFIKKKSMCYCKSQVYSSNKTCTIMNILVTFILIQPLTSGFMFWIFLKRKSVFATHQLSKRGMKIQVPWQSHDTPSGNLTLLGDYMTFVFWGHMEHTSVTLICSHSTSLTCHLESDMLVISVIHSQNYGNMKPCNKPFPQVENSRV